MRTTTRVVVALVLLASAAPAAAEAPPRERYEDNMIVTRTQWYDPVGTRYGGVWLLDPTSLDFTRLHPFAATTDSDQGIKGFVEGFDGALASYENTIAYETWPARFEFDPLTWRLIRRLPAMSQPPEHVGWVVQGPLLDDPTASPLGLAPGAYGFARCVRQLLGWGPPTLFCEPWPFDAPWGPPGVAILEGSDNALLAQPLDKPWQTPTTAAVFEPHAWPSLDTLGQIPVALSVDRARAGFWQGIPRGVQLLPVTDGQVGNPTTTYSFTFPPFDRDEIGLLRLYYHEASGQLFGVAETVAPAIAGDERHLFRFEPSTGEGELLQSWVPPNREQGTPIAFTALGPAPQHSVQLVPIVGGGPGANGTNWTTELWLYNPDDAPQEAALRRVTHPNQERTITIPAHGSTAIVDTMAWLGGGAGADGTAHEAVVVTARSVWGRQLVVQGRISTLDPATGGRYGHSLPAVPGRLGYSNHVPFALEGDPELTNVLFPGLDGAHFDLDMREPGRYRYNIGITNDHDEPVTIRLLWGFAHNVEHDLRGGVRPQDTIATITVPGHGVTLYAISDLFPASVREVWAPRIGVFGERPAVLWLSMIDNLTGDATFVPYTSCPHVNDSDQDVMTLPVVAHLPGRNGSRWQTDLIGYHANDNTSVPVVARYWPDTPATACNGTGDGGPIADNLYALMPVAPGALDAFRAALAAINVPEGDAGDLGYRTLIPDAVRAFEDCETDDNTKGALDIATGAWYSGFSRTYTTRQDGGTYGAMLPLYPIGGWPVQHFAGLAINDDQRVNLGLYNGLDHPVTHRLVLYTESGGLAATTTLELAPHEHVQEPLTRLLGPLADGLYGLTVLPLDDPDAGVEGRSWAYVSIIDNVTNDPINLW